MIKLKHVFLFRWTSLMQGAWSFGHHNGDSTSTFLAVSAPPTSLFVHFKQRRSSFFSSLFFFSLLLLGFWGLPFLRCLFSHSLCLGSVVGLRFYLPLFFFSFEVFLRELIQTFSSCCEFEGRKSMYSRVAKYLVQDLKLERYRKSVFLFVQ